jgi:hypothetical protein
MPATYSINLYTHADNDGKQHETPRDLLDSSSDLHLLVFHIYTTVCGLLRQNHPVL